MPLFQWFRSVAGTICPSRAAAVVGPSRAPQGMKKGRRPRRRPRLKLSDKAGPDQCPVPGENALFPAQIAGFLAVSRPVPVYPVFLNYVVPVHVDSIVLPQQDCTCDVLHPSHIPAAHEIRPEGATHQLLKAVKNQVLAVYSNTHLPARQQVCTQRLQW